MADSLISSLRSGKPVDWNNLLSQGLSAFGTWAGGQATAASLESYAQAGFASAAALKSQAKEVPKAAAWEVTRARKLRREAIGNLIHAAGYAGVTMSGTMLDLVEATQREMRLDEDMLFYRGQVYSKQLLEEAAWSEKMAKMQEKAGEKSSLFAGIGAGAGIGAAVGGPVGAIIGGIAGGLFS